MEQSNEKQASHPKTAPELPPESKDLQHRVAKVISSFSLIAPETPIIIGVSGGADSVALLHLLSALFPSSQRIAVYVDHGLRPSETPAEKQLVQERAKGCSALFRSVSVDVGGEKRQQGLSTEEAARRLRYQALEELREEFQAGCIAVGHTADDQAEEILLRLIRGSGCKGLSGMAVQQERIIRPLLREKKETLISYLKERGIPFCEDSSNLDTRFLRNRIRLDLLPKLENDYNKAMRQTLLHTASILEEEDRLLQTLTQNAYQVQVQEQWTTALPEKPRQKKVLLDLSCFSLEPTAIQRRILEKICWAMESRPSFRKIELLLSLLRGKKDGEIHLSQGLRASRQGTSITFHYPAGKKAYRGRASIKKSFSPFLLPGPGRYPVPELNRELLIEEVHSLPDILKAGNLYLDPSKLHFPLLLRPALQGDRFQPLGAPGRKKISRFLSDQKIPAATRDRYPVLLSQNRIVAVLGLRIDNHFRISTTGKAAFLLQWKKCENK